MGRSVLRTRPASVPAGVGPDVATLFYGWQPAWIEADYLVPLPEE